MTLQSRLMQFWKALDLLFKVMIWFILIGPLFKKLITLFVSASPTWNRVHILLIPYFRVRITVPTNNRITVFIFRISHFRRRVVKAHHFLLFFYSNATARPIRKSFIFRCQIFYCMSKFYLSFYGLH